MEKVLGNILFLIGDQRGAKTNFLKDLELPSSTIGDWKNGRNKSYMKRLPEIASYFDVSVDYLLGNTDIKKTPSSEEESETKKPTLFGYQEEEHFHVAPRNSGHSEEISPVTETVKNDDPILNKMVHLFKQLSPEQQLDEIIRMANLIKK